jgi:predicted 2-oxoglutarate/Fe(II)-dependent dioxygenase YbiX
LAEHGAILELMTTESRPKRRHLPNSPFQPEPEVVVERYDRGDLVSHDTHGVGSVVAADAHGVTVNFRARTLRVMSPFAKMEKL